MSVAVSSTREEAEAIRLIRDAERSPSHRRVASKARDRAALGLYDDPRTNGALTPAQWGQVVSRAVREAVDAHELYLTARGNCPDVVP